MPESPQVEEWGFFVCVVKYSMDLEQKRALRVKTLENVRSWILDCSSQNCPEWYECERGNQIKAHLREHIDYRIELTKKGDEDILL